MLARTPQSKHRTGRWSLSELASGPSDARLEAQIAQLQKKTDAFARIRKSLTPAISQKKFASALGLIEDIADAGSRITGYASLLDAADTQSDEATSLLMRVSKIDSEISNKILFFNLWWKRGIDQKTAARLASRSDELAEYLLHRRRLAQYSLSEPEEKIINTLDVTGASALVSLYDKITNAYQYKMRINKRLRTMTREEITNYVRSPTATLRKAAYVQILSRYDSEKAVIGQIYQNVVQNWADELVKIRGYDSAISARNLGNNLDDKTVESLLAVCRDGAPVFQKFFALKAKLLRAKRLKRYDLYAPAARRRRKDGKKGERQYSYDGAVRTVLDTLGKFSPELGEYAFDIVSKGHIDSEPRPGKRDGAFCSTISPHMAPYILMSFTGKIRDVFTLAHEMGHAVHSQAANARSILVQHAPLPLAETASTFSEMLLYEAMENDMSDEERLWILTEKIDDLYATIMRQSYFTMFEIEAHRTISEDNGTIDDLSKAYLQNLREQFGKSVDVSDDFAIEWGCIPHFYHTPFYCYAYSFGNLLSLALFQRYKKEGSGFVPTYMDILAAGGSQKPETLLASHGLDITARGFWQDGFEYVSEQVRRLESLLP